MTLWSAHRNMCDWLKGEWMNWGADSQKGTPFLLQQNASGASLAVWHSQWAFAVGKLSGAGGRHGRASLKCALTLSWSSWASLGSGHRWFQVPKKHAHTDRHQEPLTDLMDEGNKKVCIEKTKRQTFGSSKSSVLATWNSWTHCPFTARIGSR